MQELVQFIAETLVDQPEEVSVRESEPGRRLELEVAQDDLGRIIGRKGRTAQAIRTLLKVASGSGRGGGLTLDIVGPPESGTE